MKRCVKKRVALFLATATLVTSTGLTSLAEVLSDKAGEITAADESYSVVTLGSDRYLGVNEWAEGAVKFTRTLTYKAATENNATALDADSPAKLTTDFLVKGSTVSKADLDEVASKIWPGPDKMPEVTWYVRDEATKEIKGTIGDQWTVDGSTIYPSWEEKNVDVEAIVEVKEGGAVDKDGNPINLTVNPIKAADKIKEAEKEAIIKDLKDAGDKLPTGFDIESSLQLDVTALDGYSGGKVVITLKLSDDFWNEKTKGDFKVFHVLHKHEGKWERLETDQDDERHIVKFVMDKFSPVLINTGAKESIDLPIKRPSTGNQSDRGSNYSYASSSSRPAAASTSTNSSTLVGSWKRDSKGWWFQSSNGGYVRNRWGVINGTWYYFDNSGYMQTGWIQYNGAWYYCNPNVGGPEGAMMTGWVNDNGRWYYLGRTGMMETGWVQVNGVWYYLNPVSDGTRGAMAVNTWIGNYYVGADGAWQQGRTR